MEDIITALPRKGFASEAEVKAWLEDNSCGSGDGDGSGDGSGDGDGDGSGDGSGDGYGSGDGSGDITQYAGHNVHSIDGVLTIIRCVHGMFAKGYAVRGDLQLIEICIAKGEGFFAHGATIKEAAEALHEKIFEEKSEEERIAEFVAEFPSLDCVVKGSTLHSWHHILTGSCKQGRDLFCSDNGLPLDSYYTVAEFVTLTKNAYGGEIIRKLKSHYDAKR